MVRKVPCIPPIYHNNEFISKTKEKCKLFNLNFSGRCTPLVNNSQLPIRFTTHADSVLTSLDFTVEQISNIIKKLDRNKTHTHKKISIRMLKLYVLIKEYFQMTGKKANVVPIHKK